MAAFSLDADTAHPADFAIVRDGGLAMYWALAVLADAERDFKDLGYTAVGLDATDWDGAQLHRDFAAALDFPDYYGGNFNALADCLSDVAHGDYGWDRSTTGLAVSIRGFADFARQNPGLATETADVLAGASRAALLFGHRLIWLLHVDDAGFTLGSVGCLQVPWNPREWLDSNRR